MTYSRALGAGVCSFETTPSFYTGAANLYSNAYDMARWYLSLFVMKNTSVISNASLQQIVHPWTPIGGGDYYAQGVFVTYNSLPVNISSISSSKSAESLWPDVIYYTGSLPCVSTSNILNFTGAVPFFSAAYSNALVLNTTEANYLAAADTSFRGNAWPTDFMGGYVNNLWSDPTPYNQELLSWVMQTYPYGVDESTTTSSSNNNNKPSSLSAGTIVGISIACVVGLVSVVVIAFFALKERRARKGMMGGTEGSLASKDFYKRDEPSSV